MRHSLPWLKAKVSHLAILNYEVDAELLSPYVPYGLEIDLWEGQSFVSIVGFTFRQPRIFDIPVPCCQAFEQANLRFYVRRHTEAGLRRGVVFVCEVVPKRIVAFVARHILREKYVYLPMNHHITCNEKPGQRQTRIEYQWYHHGRWHGIQVQADHDPGLPEPGSQDAFFIERDWGYTLRPDGSCLEYRFEHPRWQIRPASAAAFTCDQGDIFGPDFGACLFKEPGSAFISEGSEIELFPPHVLLGKT